MTERQKDKAVDEYMQKAGRLIPPELLSFESPKYTTHNNPTEAGKQISPKGPRMSVKVSVEEIKG